MTIGRSVLFALLLAPATASASTFTRIVCVPPDTAAAATREVVEANRIWRVRFIPAAAPADVAAPRPAAVDDTQGTPRAKAFEYSHGYEVRRKIHVVASIATLPLFVTQVALGQKLYASGGDSVRSAHLAVAGGVAALFGINTVTGVWNLWEGRKNPTHRGRRLAHGLMMLGADAGFVATGLLAPDRDDPNRYLDRRSTHRAVALTSMGVATASYLMMLFWN